MPLHLPFVPMHSSQDDRIWETVQEEDDMLQPHSHRLPHYGTKILQQDKGGIRQEPLSMPLLVMLSTRLKSSH